MSEPKILSIEARATRHIVGRVGRGRGLQEALRALVDDHGLEAAWLNAMGAFEWIELTEYSQSKRRYENAHRVESCELLSMQGNLSEREGEPFWHLHATVSVRKNGRDETYGGHVVDGVVFALELRIDCFDELRLRREDDAATGLKLWADLGSSASTLGPADELTAERQASPVTWAMAAELSARAEPSQEQHPQRGDWIDHPKFGLCKIESLSGGGVCIIKLPDARRKKIKIDAMLVLPPRDESGRKVFPVRSKSKG